MRVSAALLRLARANVRQQLRGSGFPLALAAALLGGYLAVPPPGAGYVVFGIGRVRGVYNSAWVGSSLALMTAFLLGLLGFYLVRGGRERDRRTGVGRILAASQVSTGQLLLAKALANTAVLGLLVGTVALVGPFMQLAAGEAGEFQLVPYLTPFLLVTLPVMGAVATTALLFDAIRPLRGVAGNILYLFLWAATSAMARRVSGTNPFHWFYGIDPLLTAAAEACRAAVAGCTGEGRDLAAGVEALPDGVAAITFAWGGVDWSPALAGGRLLLLAAALGAAGLAGLLIARSSLWAEHHGAVRLQSTEGARDAAPGQAPPPAPRPLCALGPSAVSWALWPMLRAEFALLVRRLTWWQALLGLALIAIGLVVPAGQARAWLLPFSWLWPVVAWRQLGCREVVHGVEPVLFAAPRPVVRQLVAQWGAGVLFTLLAGSGAAFRLWLDGGASALLPWVAGSLLIPALALCLGVWSRGQRLFEVAYLILWYLGPVEGVYPLDFAGARLDGLWPAHAAAALVLVAAAMAGRHRQSLGR